MSLISYTLPCHKRAADLMAVWPSVIAAAVQASPVEIVVVDYGNPLWLELGPGAKGVTLRTVRCEAESFHMAHARNVGIQAARGDIIVAFLADQIISQTFFDDVRSALQPGTFLKWRETFAFWRDDIVAAGGFDERFEFYGPEGKELADRLERRGLRALPFPASCGISQIRTPNAEKVRHYRLKLSKVEMHERGMAIWRDTQARAVTVANEGQPWGQVEVPAYA
jgi:hypothetical protein